MYNNIIIIIIIIIYVTQSKLDLQGGGEVEISIINFYVEY